MILETVSGVGREFRLTGMTHQLHVKVFHYFRARFLIPSPLSSWCSDGTSDYTPRPTILTPVKNSICFWQWSNNIYFFQHAIESFDHANFAISAGQKMTKAWKVNPFHHPSATNEVFNRHSVSRFFSKAAIMSLLVLDLTGSTQAYLDNTSTTVNR